MLRKNNPSKTGKVDAEKPEIVTYYFSIGNEWQRNYFICKGKLSTSPLRNKQLLKFSIIFFFLRALPQGSQEASCKVLCFRNTMLYPAGL